MTTMIERVAQAIEPEIDKAEMLLADPLTLRRLKARRIARAAIEAMRDPAAPVTIDVDWQPMDTAPKSPLDWRTGPRLLMTDGELVSFGRWEDGGYDGHSYWLCEATTTHTDGPGSQHHVWEKEPIGWAPESAIRAKVTTR